MRFMVSAVMGAVGDGRGTFLDGHHNMKRSHGRMRRVHISKISRYGGGWGAGCGVIAPTPIFSGSSGGSEGNNERVGDVL